MKPVASEGRLVLAALLGIGVIVALIIGARLHPFLALTAGALTVGVTAGVSVETALTSLHHRLRHDRSRSRHPDRAGSDVRQSLLADSGGADQIVDTIIGAASPRMLPWAMAVVGAIIGLPMFFEIGLVLLMPVIYLVARRSGQSLVTIGIPALAGLSAMHGLVPPHPGPLTAIDYLGADLGTTLALGVAVAIPTVIIAGPVFGLVGRYVAVPVPDRFEGAGDEDTSRRPSFAITLASVLLPVVLMMGKALADIFVDDEGDPLRRTLDILGTPLIALLIAVVVGMFTLGHGMGRDGVAKSLESSLPGVAGILLIVSAGGGFKQSLVDTGIGTIVAERVADSNISVLLLAWFVAVLIRLATGSATVATVTASGLLAPLTDQALQR
ncbi:SLC13 family permease [Nocardioides convexus]|uniref:GntP family permease n=1 Tax=Nocardioides convexus TaxID=2712224 RepID=UPI002418B35B|nr:SLC13 family permease [Nocardioides convexus]